MNKKLFWIVTLFLLAIGTFAEAHQAGEIFPHRFPGFEHCFWYGGARGDVPARAEQAWMD